MAYGDKRDFPKIHIYLKIAEKEFAYHGSTTWAKTCKEARQRFHEKTGYPLDEIKCIFVKD